MARCEIEVSITSEHHTQLLVLLKYDKRPSGGTCGRSLTTDYPPLQLKTGDRLEPSPTLLNVSDFDKVVVFVPPLKVISWRRSRETIMKRRCALWNEAIGLKEDIIVYDVLHTFLLGPLLLFCVKTLWVLLLRGQWGLYERTAEERNRVGILMAWQALKEFYREWRVQNPEKTFTELSDLNRKMVGTAAEPDLKIKAMECWGLCISWSLSVGHNGPPLD